MLTLIVILLLTFGVLAALLTLWSAWIQNYWYTEVTSGLAWRAPAAAGGVMVVLLLWVVLAARSPGSYRPLWEVTSSEDSKPFPELRIPKSGGEEVYKLRPGTRGEYRLNGLPGGKALPSRPPEVIVLEDGQKVTFKAERDDKGNFKQRETRTMFGVTATSPLRYVDDRGRVMLEGELGIITNFRSGLLLANLLLNGLLLGVWFVVLWLVLRFQWWHALLQALVLWLALLLFVMPPILTIAERPTQPVPAASETPSPR